MANPASSTARRRAWINSSRKRSSLEELSSNGPACISPSYAAADDDDDDVFADGSFTGKIEYWLQSCGLERCSENSHRSFESVPRANNLEDELSLGADACALTAGEIPSGGNPGHQRPCLKSMNTGQRTSTSLLSSTTRTTSSISDVLQLCSEDAEETLYELGFGCDEPQVTVRIPPRFFTFPSQAQGINFRLFLDSQLCRIKEEDPSLSIASRFRQVQVLTAMANAFYSLYSHVSRTPLQKLATPQFTFTSSPVEKMERFRSNICSEPRSPVDRLKDTVSKMCLYTGSPCQSDSTSPQSSPRKRLSLPDVVDVVHDKVKTGANKKLDFGDDNVGSSAVDISQALDVDTSGRSGATEKTHKTTEGVFYKGNEQFLSCQPKQDFATADVEPVVKVTYELICHHHQGPFCCRHVPSVKGHVSPHISLETHLPPRQKTQVAVSEPDGDSRAAASSEELTAEETGGPLPVLAQYRRSATEGDDSFNSAQACEDSLSEGQSWHLRPRTLWNLGRSCNNLQQANSFELEEVHSAGEEDAGQSETTRTVTSPPPTNRHDKGAVVRGDSVQSDSSGFADEDISPLSDKRNRPQGPTVTPSSRAGSKCTVK